MIKALQELAGAPDGKHINHLSQTICSYLLSCYKDDGQMLLLSLLSFSFHFHSIFTNSKFFGWAKDSLGFLFLVFHFCVISFF